jgi:hypothetical protein
LVFIFYHAAKISPFFEAKYGFKVFLSASEILEHVVRRKN